MNFLTFYHRLSLNGHKEPAHEMYTGGSVIGETWLYWDILPILP